MEKQIWQKSRQELFRDLNCGVNGLTAAEAAQRLDRYGPNELQAAGKKSVLRIFLEQFQDILVLILLVAIVARCIQVGTRSQDYLRRLVCFGAATALIFQICSNVGMCIGVTPVIGLTLPFISYGGSSILSLYAMLGLVSGVFARPAPRSHELYVRPY